MRYARLGLHLLWGALTIATVYRFLNATARLWLKQRWSRQLLEILAIRLDANLHGVARGSLIVANHISWLDIFVLNAARPMAFVSKSEVREWPLAGWLAANTDTLFLRRGRRADAAETNARIGAMLASGKDVAVFPEGTTGDGRTLLPFHANLLEAALAADAPVQPVGLRFIDRATGATSFAPSYIGDETLIGSIWRTLSAPAITAVVHFGPPEHAQGRERRAWSAHLHRVVDALRQVDCS